jgi:soluble lytic murein transglycosylase-like protein
VILEQGSMKQLRVGLSQVLRRNSTVASISSYAACFALAALSLCEHHTFLEQTELRVAREVARLAKHASTLPALTNSATDRAKIEFVSTMIKQELPARTDSDELARVIVTESQKADIDPLFVAAIVRAESMFSRTAVSRRGAKGLMQLMPATGQYLSKISKIELKAINDLHNPEINIKLGIWYLKYLEHRFGGSREHQLVAYNWGPANLVRALSSGASYPRESIHYVHKVLSQQSLWASQLAQVIAERGRTAIG